VKVLIADDHRLFLTAIRHALARADDIQVVAEATDGTQVLPLVRRTNPDVVLLDLRMPQMDGLACIDQLRKHALDVKIVVLSAYDDADHVHAAFKRGANGYIVKSINPDDLPSALRQAMDGTFFSPVEPAAAGDVDVVPSAGLTERELDILKALARGLSNQRIGKEFWITEQTVKFHLSNIYRKLGVSSRTEATHYAYEHGLVETPLYAVAGA
jgi:DNA-binding NarL/FixJ family response regulator